MEMVISSGNNVSSSLSQHFGYELSDKKAKYNLLKGANREALEIQDRQKCVMMDLSTGAYLEIIIPTVKEWEKVKGNEFAIEDMNIKVDEVSHGYDENLKHVQSIVRFVANNNKVAVTCYNTTQRIKTEGKGYQNFVEKFLKPLLLKKLSKAVLEKIEKYNQDVITALSGKRKAVSRPMRRMRYKAMTSLSCSKCDLSFKNDAQLKKHKTLMHTKGINDSSGSMKSFLLVEDTSLLSDSDNELESKNMIEYSKKEQHVPDLHSSGEKAVNKHIDSTHAEDKESEQHVLPFNANPDTIETLEESSQVVTRASSSKCNECGFTFTSLSDLKGHMQEIHTKKDALETSIITTVVDIEEPPQSPILSDVNTNMSIVCCLCKLESKNIEELRKHIENIHADDTTTENEQDVIQSQGKETCSFCGKCSFNGTKYELCKHFKVKHAQTFKCDQCGNSFPDVQTLKDHLDARHCLHPQIEPFPCEWCGLYFLSFGLLEQHVQNFHQQHKPERCHYCSETFITVEELQSHMRGEHEEIVILCTMARQVDDMNDKFLELMNKIDKLEENSNSMKQELFILRNEQKNNRENFIDKKELSKAETKPTPNTHKVTKREKSINLPKETSAKKPQIVEKKTLFVGDSVSDVTDFHALEEATETKIVHVKAYSAVFDEISNDAKISARFPKRNFTDVIPAALEKEEFRNVIVQSGSVDITNLQTKTEVEKNFDYFHQQSVMSAQNLFLACENALRSHSNIETSRTEQGHTRVPSKSFHSDHSKIPS